jgi:nucleotide-binding universal stress UspA family protein
MILCCTDLAETSRPALQEALRMADALGVPLTVLHVCPLPYPAPGYLSLAVEDADLLDLAGERVRRAAETSLTALVSDAKASLHLEHVATHPVVREGLAAEMIVEEAENRGAELIVVGTHARTGLPRLLLGSVAERVMRTATRPVLTVAPGLR